MRYAAYLVLLSFFAAALSAQVPTTPATEAGADKYTGDLVDIPLTDIMRMTSERQNIRFLYDSKIIQLQQKTITMISSQKQGITIPYGAWFSVLQICFKQHKLVTVPFGEDSETSVRFFEIMPVNDAIGQAAEVIFLDDLAEWNDNRASIVSLVVNLKYAESNSVAGALRAMVKPPGNVQPIPGVNSLLVSDYSYNIRRIGMMLNLMDQPARSPRLEVVNVEHLDAAELSNSINQLLTARKNAMVAQPRRQGSPDDETLVFLEPAPYVNAIMVTGFDAGIELVRDLVAKLDVDIPGAVSTGRMHIYQCKNVLAMDLADTLNNLLGAGIPLPTAVPTQPGQPLTSANNPNAPTIVPNEKTNSLVVIATPSDYVELRKLIEKLDMRRPQVQIQVAILEVSDSDGFEFGVELASVDGFSKNSKEPRASFGTSFGYSSIVDDTGLPVGGTNGGIPAGRSPNLALAGGIFTLTKGSAFEIPLIVRFLKTQSDTNVLSEPMVTTNDNEPAQINISTEIQLVENTQNATTGNTQGAGPIAEAGINLSVTPQINQDDHVTLEIDLEVSSFQSPPATGAASAPPKSKRTIVTKVTVPNRNTVIIGGLKSSESRKSVSKIPLLGDIPLLGELFKKTTTQENRTNLYIFVRPVILHDPNFDDLEKLSRDALEDAKKQILPSDGNREFFKKALADYEEIRRTTPGTPSRSFDYQGLDKK
ncbi:MAG: hypothetical protein IT462_15040 [Planctomycetes bacterium]|nr:hypothetical protein [Planctomycetota bacterium]